MCACAGEARTPFATCWAELPYELEELILAKLSLTELARVSATCRTIQAVFDRQMAEAQKAHCDLAIKCFGRERIACIASLGDRYLMGQAMHAELDQAAYNSYICVISADGTLHVEPHKEQLSDLSSGTLTCECTDIHVDLSFWSTSMRLAMLGAGFGRVDLHFDWHHQWATISRGPDGDVDAGLALCHALLDGNVAPAFHDHALRVEVQLFIVGVYDRQALQAQIAPLMPLASQFTFEDNTVAGHPVIKAHARLESAGSGAWITITVSTSG
jgi:hypothetical protein